MSFHRFQLLFQAATPIAHGDTVTGIDNQTNTRLFMRQGMLVNEIPARVPAISENALRATIFRNPLADHLVGALQIEDGALPQGVMNLLFAGGNMAAGSKAPAQEVALGIAARALYPSIDLLGGAVDAFILPRACLRLACWLVADEYAATLRLVAPELEDEARQVSAFDLVTEETRTRGTGRKSDGNQMLYTYETLAAGAKILLEVTIDAQASPAAVAAAGMALQAWDGYIGGQGRQGRGRVVLLAGAPPPPTAYADHIEEHRAAMRAGLLDGTFGTGAKLCAA